MPGLDRLADFLFGFDYFISCAHADGQNYARELAARLEAAGFSVFLDQRVDVAGDDLRVATRRRIRMSKQLVIIVRAHVLASDWVRKAVELSLGRGRVPIAIDINDALARAPDENSVKVALTDTIFIPETLDDADGEPSPAVVMELITGFEATRQQTLRVRALSIAAVLFAGVALLAGWQYYEARANAIESYTRCEETRRQVTTGLEKLDSLGQRSAFGRLVSGIAEKVAELPDPTSLKCSEDPR